MQQWKSVPLQATQDKRIKDSPIDFTARLSPIEKRWCIEIGERCAALMKSEGAPLPGTTDALAFVELNPVIAVMDIAVVHVHRNLNLVEFAKADNLTMRAEYALIERHINRPLCVFPKDVKLKFARG